jgi:hypothetical protein
MPGVPTSLDQVDGKVSIPPGTSSNSLLDLGDLAMAQQRAIQRFAVQPPQLVDGGKQLTRQHLRRQLVVNRAGLTGRKARTRLGQQTDGSGLTGFIGNYCLARPLDPVSKAAIELIHELEKQPSQ